MALLGNIGIRKPGTQDQWNDGKRSKDKG